MCLSGDEFGILFTVRGVVACSDTKIGLGGPLGFTRGHASDLGQFELVNRMIKKWRSFKSKYRNKSKKKLVENRCRFDLESVASFYPVR